MRLSSTVITINIFKQGMMQGIVKQKSKLQYKRQRTIFKKAHKLGKLNNVNIVIIVGWNDWYWMYKNVEKASFPSLMQQIVSLTDQVLKHYSFNTGKLLPIAQNPATTSSGEVSKTQSFQENKQRSNSKHYCQWWKIVILITTSSVKGDSYRIRVITLIYNSVWFISIENYLYYNKKLHIDTDFKHSHYSAFLLMK